MLSIVALLVISSPVLAGSFWPGDRDWERALQVGDYVIYRVSGSATVTPFEIKKEVIAKRGEQMVVEVIATRGTERRQWMEEDSHVQREVTPPTGWLPLMPVAAAPVIDKTVVHLESWSFECRRSFGETTSNGTAAKVKMIACDEFPWGVWESSVWNEEQTIVDVEVVETGRGGYVQIACPAGTTLNRVKQFNAIEEACVRGDGTREGPWSKRDGHGKPLVIGRYRDGKQQGLRKDNQFGLLEEHCMFDAGNEVSYTRPAEWTHLRLGVAGGVGSGFGAGVGGIAVTQVGWDILSRARHCRPADAHKDTKHTALAAVGDVQLFAPTAAITTLVRLGLQAHFVFGEAQRGYLDTGLLETGLFASVGALVYPEIGLGASLGVDYFLGLRLEARYDYLPTSGGMVSVNLGLSDGVLAVFN